MTRSFAFCCGLVVAIGSPTVPGLCQQVTLDTLSLFKLPGVRVAVGIPPIAEADGLEADALTALMEATLRRGGIQVFSEDQWQVTLGNPLLLLTLEAIRPSEHFYIFDLQLELKQLVVLARDSTIPAFATTWKAGNVVGTVPTQQIGNLEQHVRGQVDQFVAAVAVANRQRRRWIREERPPYRRER